jgi:hypothetical protein
MFLGALGDKKVQQQKHTPATHGSGEGSCCSKQFNGKLQLLWTKTSTVGLLKFTEISPQL